MNRIATDPIPVQFETVHSLIPMERSTEASEHRFVQRCGCTSEWCFGDEDEYVTQSIALNDAAIHGHGIDSQHG